MSYVGGSRHMKVVTSYVGGSHHMKEGHVICRG